MILILLLILFDPTLSETYFDNSVLQIKPWGLRGTCDPKPDNCKAKIDSNRCINTCNTTNCIVQVLVVLPDSEKYLVNLDEADSVLQNAVNLSKLENYIQEKVDFNFVYFDDGCDQEKATASIVKSALAEYCTNIIIGPVCEYSLATVARGAKYLGLGVPLFTSTGLTFDFTKKKTEYVDEMYSLINSGYADYRSYGEFLHMMMAKFGWTKVVLMYDKVQYDDVAGSFTCQLFMKTIMEELISIEQLDYVDGDLLVLGINYTDFLTNKVGVNYGIILTCVGSQILREIAVQAEKLKMFDRGEYTIFNFELYNNATIASKPWYEPNDTNYNNQLAKHAYQSIYTITPWKEAIFDSIDNVARKRGSIWFDGITDAMLIYTQALNLTLTEMANNNLIDQGVLGCDVLYNVMGNTFKGRDGEDIIMNCNAQRVTKFALLNVDAQGDYKIVGSYSILNKTIEYWALDWKYGEIIDTPKCGYDLSKCPEYNAVNILLISLISVVVIALAIVIFATYRHFKLKSEIYSMAWKINFHDILLFPVKPRRNSAATLGSVNAEADGYSVLGDKQLYVTVGYYKSIKVAIKRMKDVKVDLNRDKLVELKVMKDLSNDNLVKFYGASLDIPNCILTEYCPKGSLQDILENDQVKLDWTFRMSLIMDLVRGMHYIHGSAIKSHGSLKSSNCLVDSRFVLKISDFGLHFLRNYFEYDEDMYDEKSHLYWKSQLWTAPELLRMRDYPAGGSQKGDVYSFGIIMHEIITRQGAFYLGEQEPFMLAKEIVDAVRKGTDANNGQPLRPLITDLNEEVAQLMNNCWAEDTADRPDFSTLKSKLRNINKESDGNLLDNLLARMEQYANNLEALVEERTADYLEEKRKCEELLYQLLPKTVAQQLINGNSVLAETFDQVTIYFSDIVGFTALSAESTPLQVVDLLNDLYTCFDSIIENFDVYKVETIGDAYMVVSGLPERNGNQHAREIARMSLALLNEVTKFQIRHKPDKPLQLRIGIHTGPCVAGVVGLKMPRYCLFGDTVNTASRMESNGLPLKIHVSPVTKRVLDQFETFSLECRGEVEIKGKGKMVTYWLNGEQKIKFIKQSDTQFECNSNNPPSTPIPKHSCGRLLSSNGRFINTMPSQHQDDSDVPLLSITSPDSQA